MTRRSLKADSLLSLRNRIWLRGVPPPILACMWAPCNGVSLLPTFYRNKTECAKACEKLLEENITAVPKRVNISITFPSTSSGDIS